ncbi:MAG: hypothetical protein OXC57_12685 [Rhodobacteraceae bacterium]|nr:hypothetical protein [Paracoccaceae bacterium]
MTRPCAIPWAAGRPPVVGDSLGGRRPRTDSAGPDAHLECSDGWNSSHLKGESRKQDFPRDSPTARRAGGAGFYPAGRWTGYFQADPPSGIAWAFNPGQTTVNQP